MIFNKNFLSIKNHHHHHHYHHHHHQHYHNQYISKMISYLLIIMFASTISTVNMSKIRLCQSMPKFKFYDIVSHLANTTNLRNSNETLFPEPKYFQSPFDQNNNSYITLIALISQQDDRTDTDAWLNNLEHIYQNFVKQISFKDIRFMLINSKESYNPAWVYQARKNVSFEIYQELAGSPIGSLLDGHSGDVYLFDRCNLLAYYIRFPLSIIDLKDPFFQATILAAHSDSPCKEKCSNQSKNTLPDLQSATTLMPELSETTDNSSNNETSTTSEEETNPLANVLAEMGEVLQSFYDRYTMNFETADNSTTTNISTTIQNETIIRSHLIESLNQPLNTYEPMSIILEPNSTNVSHPQNRTMVQELRPKIDDSDNQEITPICNKTICNEWNTEKLLAARLCCMSFTTEDDQVEEPIVNVNASEYIPSNGGFGCKLYARSSCSLIKPILRCCTRKLVNEYFNYTMKLRGQKLGNYGQRLRRNNSNRMEKINPDVLQNWLNKQ